MVDMKRQEWRAEIFKAMKSGDTESLIYLSKIYKQKINNGNKNN